MIHVAAASPPMAEGAPHHYEETKALIAAAPPGQHYFDAAPTPPMEVSQGAAIDPARPLLNGFIRDRPAFSHVEVRLAPGEKVRASAKAMIWMDGNISLLDNCCIFILVFVSLK
jgi:hypothetical protein